jgi:hypothetical protein
MDQARLAFVVTLSILGVVGLGAVLVAAATGASWGYAIAAAGFS